MDKGLFYLNGLALSLFDAFPTYDVEVSIRRPSERKKDAGILTLTVRLYDEAASRMYAVNTNVVLWKLEQMIASPEEGWQAITESVRKGLLEELEKSS